MQLLGQKTIYTPEEVEAFNTIAQSGRTKKFSVALLKVLSPFANNDNSEGMYNALQALINGKATKSDIALVDLYFRKMEEVVRNSTSNTLIKEHCNSLMKGLAVPDEIINKHPVLRSIFKADSNNIDIEKFISYVQNLLEKGKEEKITSGENLEVIHNQLDKLIDRAKPDNLIEGNGITW